MTIPYTFAGATTAIPLSNLDANFASPITLGNVAMTLSNTYTSIGNLTLTNVTVSSGNVAATNANVTTLTVGGSTQNQQLGQGDASIMKNRIINGAMVIDQRNAGASVTPTNGSYTLDRWQCQASQSSKFTVQQNAGSVTPPVGFSNYLGVTSTSAYSIGAADYFAIDQSIEGFNFADCQFGTANAKTITISAWVYSSLTGTFGGAVLNNAYSRAYPFTYSIPVANTWTQISVTIAGDTTGTWVGATNSIGIQVSFGLGVGANQSATAGSWTAAGKYSATGAVSVVGTNGATFYITGVQLEVGSSATGFEYENVSQTVQKCQRYYQKTYNIGTKPAATGGYAGGIFSGAIYNNKGSTAGVNEAAITWQYKTSMRTSPTITFYSPATGTAGNFVAGSTDNTAGINGPIIGENNSLGYGTASAVGSGNDCYFHMTASAEL